MTLENILKKKVWICNDKDKNLRRYCIGRINNDEEEQIVIIAFGEESVGKLLNDLFDCKSYINPGVYTPMDCYLPNPLFNTEYDTWENEIFDEIKEIKYSDAKELKNMLVQRFEYKWGNEWLCFEGYGGANFESKCCPLCGGVMIAEASSLRIRYIQAVHGTHVPILICSSCNEAIKYTENVNFCDNNGKEYIEKSEKDSLEKYNNKNALIKLLKSNEQISICFDMFSNEKKIFQLEMTLVHRVICLNLLEDKKESNEPYN